MGGHRVPTRPHHRQAQGPGPPRAPPPWPLLGHKLVDHCRFGCWGAQMRQAMPQTQRATHRQPKWDRTITWCLTSLGKLLTHSSRPVAYSDSGTTWRVQVLDLPLKRQVP